MSAMPNPGLDQLDAGLRLTAAVSTTFDPLQFAAQPIGAINALAAVCEEVDVAGASHRQWQMQGDARRAVLRSLKKQPDFAELLSSVEVSSDDRFAAYVVDGLAGTLPTKPAAPGAGGPSDAVDLDDLLQAVRLLDDISDAESSYEDTAATVRRQIALNDADDALLAVIPPRLIGRDDHLARLSTYCATPWPTSRWVPSLVIEGPGGAGKSALVSTFVYTQRRDPSAAPLVYFDFDRARLIGAGPIDLTIEFTRQLGLADATLEPALAEFRERSEALLSDSDPAIGVDSTGGTAAAALRDLGSVLSGWPRREGPITIVLDTFEEVAIRGYTAVRDVLQWAADLSDSAFLPQLRLVVCGRAVIPDAPHVSPKEVRAMFNEVVPPLFVGDLSDGDATTLLMELGVDGVTAWDLPPVFGGNPLVLKLLHRFIAANDTAGVAQLLSDGRAARRQSPTAEIGLRFVYERILKRIENPVVQALAYPGVVLRRVTPELILQVLARASTIPLDVHTEERAHQAFAELAQHVWLVSRVGDDVVEHRADVRRLLVPGLETSPEIDARRIHQEAVAYYAAQPPSVDARTAWVEENYHLGFLDDDLWRLTPPEAEEIVLALGPDIEFWPLRARAKAKSWAGRHETLSEEEVASLGWEDQYATRDARMDKYRSLGDVGHSSWEERQLDAARPGGGTMAVAATTPTIPNSRWVLLFDRGEFEFMRDSARSLHTVDRFFEDRPRHGLFLANTHDHPWYIALAYLMLDNRSERLLAAETFPALEPRPAAVRLYGAALTAVAGDRAGHERILESLGAAELQGYASSLGISERTLGEVDEAIIVQAALSAGGLTELRTIVSGDAFDMFRLSHLSEIARATRDSRAPELLAEFMEQHARTRPATGDLNRLRVTLRQETPHPVLDAAGLRAAPTLLSFLYGAIRATLDPLDQAALLEVIGGIENRSIFWPSDQTAEAIGRMRAGLSPSTLTGLIETADRCGLLIDLVDAAASRTGTRLAHQLLAGIKRLENLLFPFAKPRGELPSFR
ncbi:ATP-binding protein [Tessaracoccus caeni]|uniref:ATP-binding protein n=1 Tax=Tessaracoccus caeni TaxID=3031239 RepID=UPI0023DC1F02|nr:ATP-binding protein [Tessaracoccus caeni]MDF1489302.1 ATP-binding protein [Tessaracoccus caeni]